MKLDSFGFLVSSQVEAEAGGRSRLLVVNASKCWKIENGVARLGIILALI